MNLLKLSAAAALSLSALAHAQASDPCATAPQTCATLINTHATAQTRIPNTAVDITVGITASGKDLPAVQRDLAGKSSSLLAYLRSEQAQRLITTSVNFFPETKAQKNAVDKTVGFNGSSQVSFRTTPEKAPILLAGVLEHGATSIDSNAFTPTEEDVIAARNTLSAQATRNAVAQAEAIAQAAGLHMVAVRNVNVNESGGIIPRPMAMMAMRTAEAAAPAPPIETAAGEQSLSMRVDVTIAATK